MNEQDINKVINLKQISILKVIAEMPGRNKARISRKSGITFSYLIKILDDYENAGLIIDNKSGRECLIELTGKGYELYNLFQEMLNKLKDSEE